jgi:hypothetical protein
MDRRVAVVALMAVAGCAGIRDAVTAHQDIVARAGGQELTVTQLAELLAPVKNVPLRREVIERVADLWVDYQLLGRAAAAGDSLLDSAAIATANWPEIAQRIANHLHDQTIVARATIAPREVDSAYGKGDVRWLDHILVRVRQDTTEAVKAAKRRIAEGYLAQLRRGADFARLAKAKSEDQGTANSGGSLGLVSRGQMAKSFEDAAWGLSPGGYSQPVETPFGYHIIWRPRLDQVRDSFAAALKNELVLRLDSIYIDSLNSQTDIKVRSSAPAVVRTVAQDMRSAKTSGRVLATYKGGRLTESDFARWLQAFPMQTRAMVGQAPDSTLAEFVRSIARNEMLIRSAEARHIELTAADMDTIRQRFRVELASMMDKLGVAPDSLAVDSAARTDRASAVARRVDEYFDGIIKNSPGREFFEVPPFLSDVLRARFTWDISPVGVDRALEKAQELRGPTPPAAAAPMAPAPSGPPMSPSPQSGQGERPAPSRPPRP